MKRLSYAATALAALLTLAACSASGRTAGNPGTSGSSGSSMSMPMTSTPGGASSQTGQPSVNGAPTITIKDFGYSGSLTVKAGTRVTVVNDDSAPHSLTDKHTHKFDTGVISSGSKGFFTAPSRPGSYPFGCVIHPSMAGTLVVTS